MICLVNVGPLKGYSKHEINSTLCHEATHVWQAHEDSIGEVNTSREFEAYSIQAIAQTLMEAFWGTKTYQPSTKPF